MNDAAGALQIPSGLRPADGRFGAGPSKIQPEHLTALAATGVSLTMRGSASSRMRPSFHQSS